MTRTTFPSGTILGYPRIGRRRELKRAVESFWAGRIDEAELERTAAELRAATRARLQELGLGADDSSIPESFSYYDQVLDAAVAVGAIPERFADLVDDSGRVGLDAYFTIARGEGEKAPLEMTKWFDSNYHYLVPEIAADTAFRLADDRLVREVAEARENGLVTRPVVVGPVTLLLLSKAADGSDASFRPLDRLGDLLPVYVELLARLADAGAEWVQFDEPALVSESIDVDPADARAALATAYDALGGASARPSIFVAAPYGALDAALPVLAASPVEAIGLDLVRGSAPVGLDEATLAGLATKTLVAGVVDGHNVWRGDLAGALAAAEGLRGLGADLAVSTSTSLLHVPHDVDDEPSLDARLRSWLAFADQKVAQVAVLARGLAGERTPSPTSSRPRPTRWPTASVRRACATARCATASRASAPARPTAPTTTSASPRRPSSTSRYCRRRRSARSRRPATSAAHAPVTRAASSTTPATSRSCARRSSASSACRRRSASTCSCTASPSATTWCSTSPSCSTASRSPRTAGCSRTAAAARARPSSGATCRGPSR
ncbi:hypothetical protein ARHIZOSPH14_00360 [Agromyces rhizosphaerae]|uniref:Cobalamin-independent methionine synthase MetE N-terminal domain-containing protein n=1 Tax=Agromyces rhizosphaerae TaxID=88374 RepID=A0A9W6CUW7_9MICO|nr:hypothetical protein ARHIZOSPH14_00360 [Agromyces rhizosphaerae]